MLRRIVFACAILTLAAPAWAGDAAVKSVLDDLARIEPQIAALSPGQGAGIKRLQNLLKVTTQRLDGADRADPDFPAAADRLAKAQQALADLAAGKTPDTSAPAPAATPAPAESAPAPRASADPKVAAAQAHLAALQADVAGIQPDQLEKIVAARKDLDVLGGELKAAQNPQDPAWVDAANGYNALVGKLNALITAANAGPAPAASDDPNVARAERELSLIENQAAPMQTGDKKLAERFLGDLDRIGQALAALADHNAADWQAAETHRVALKDTIVGKRVEALTESLRKEIDRVNAMTPVQFAVAEEVAALRRDVDAIRADLDALAAPENAGVQRLSQDIAQVDGAIDERAKSAGAGQGQYGDVNARLAEIAGHARAQVPPPLKHDADKDAAGSYAAAIAGLRKQGADDIAWLDGINGKVPFDHDQAESFNSSRHALAVMQPQEIDQSLQNSFAALDGAVAQGLQYAQLLNAADPADADDQANLMTGEGRYAEYQANLNAGLAAIEAAAALDAGVGRSGAPDRAAQRKEIEAALAKFSAAHDTALASVRMPAARSSDGRLVDIATEVLGRPEYGYAFKRMVVNADLNHFDKMSGSIDENTSSDLVVTVYHWVWDEFQVTTAERHTDGKWYLFVNRMRNFVSGGPTTPTGRWILAERFQGSEILEANIDD